MKTKRKGSYSDIEKQNKIDDVINDIKSGVYLRQSLRNNNMPCSETFYRWLDKYPDKKEKYNAAKLEFTTHELYRADNARKVNENKNPNGFLYIIKLEGQSIHKVGVSQKPKRRLQDISANNPYNIEVLFMKYFEGVYELEKIILDQYNLNKIKGEWFNAYDECIKNTIGILNKIYNIENGLLSGTN